MNTLRTYLPNSFSYIDQVGSQDEQRRMHHNHVAKRFATNLQEPLAYQSKEQLSESDQDLLEYLKKLDN